MHHEKRKSGIHQNCLPSDTCKDSLRPWAPDNYSRKYIRVYESAKAVLETIFSYSLHWGQLECKITTVGKEYEGRKNVTVSGRQCQAWGSQYPHKHTFGERGYLLLLGNKCRNPDGEPGGPWCYTTDKNKRWEYCGIPLCSKCTNYELFVYLS